ncbi:helix-turn-helix domain-containing protein [Faecalibacterium sp. PGM34]
MSDFRKFLDEQLEDPELKAEWDTLQPERALVQAMIDARKRTGLTQQQLAEKTGISQSDISKFETGGGNPSIKTLQRLATGMGMILHVEFKPATGTH